MCKVNTQEKQKQNIVQMWDDKKRSGNIPRLQL
jgi:hypothetical protein